MILHSLSGSPIEFDGHEQWAACALTVHKAFRPHAFAVQGFVHLAF